MGLEPIDARKRESGCNGGALSLDPYPRSAGAEGALKEAGVMTEEQASPFAALAQLKRGNSDKP